MRENIKRLKIFTSAQKDTSNFKKLNLHEFLDSGMDQCVLCFADGFGCVATGKKLSMENFILNQPALAFVYGTKHTNHTHVGGNRR